MYYYIGIDVSKKVLNVFDGKKDLIFDNKENLSSFKKYLKKRYADFTKLVILFEATGIYSYHLKAFCAEHMIKACIINPQASHNFAKSLGTRSKTDTRDAHTIWAYHKLISDKDIRIPQVDHVLITLASYLTSYHLTLKQKLSLSNHLEEIRDKTLYRLLKKEEERLDKLEQKLLIRMDTYIKGYLELNEDYQRLLSISGIGQKTAIHLLVLFHTYPDTNRKQITALIGLDPVQRQSGSSVKSRSRISKHGNQMMRKSIYMPTLVSIKYNHKIKVFYDRLVSKHKPKKLAVIACMRKLLLMAHAIHKNKTVYVPG
ncbi:MAG: IS110 family transposase [Peptococcaceae bacterium]